MKIITSAIASPRHETCRASQRISFSMARFCLLRRLHANSASIEQLNSRGWFFPAARNAKTVKNYARRVGTIQRVEVNARDIVIQKVVTLFQGEVNADTAHAFRIVFAPLQSAQKPRRKSRSTRERRDPRQSFEGSNRHDAGDNRNMNASQRAAFAEIEKIAIVEKKLRHHVIGPRVDLCLKIVHFD